MYTLTKLLERLGLRTLLQESKEDEVDTEASYVRMKRFPSSRHNVNVATVRVVHSLCMGLLLSKRDNPAKCHRYITVHDSTAQRALRGTVRKENERMERVARLSSLQNLDPHSTSPYTSREVIGPPSYKSCPSIHYRAKPPPTRSLLLYSTRAKSPPTINAIDTKLTLNILRKNVPSLFNARTIDVPPCVQSPYESSR